VGLIGDFCEIVAAGGMRYGGYSLGWGRNIAHNVHVGGHPDSFHLAWLADDVVFPTRKATNEAARFYRRMGLHVRRNGRQTLHLQPVAPDHDILGRPVPEDT
jgi:hypothetical protein